MIILTLNCKYQCFPSVGTLTKFYNNYVIFVLDRLALLVIQRSLRKYMKLRSWPWWKMWTRVKPLLNVANIEDELRVRILND